MISTNNAIKYIKVNKENFEIAYNIQKNIWLETPDYENFINKAEKSSDENIAFIAYYNKAPIGITGLYVEDIDPKSIWLDWFGIKEEYRKKGFGKQILLDTIQYAKELHKFLYFRVETTYWNGRPAIALYDKIMPLKEKYTIEDTKSHISNTLIYTYNFTEKKELWNNRYLGLSDYYNSRKINRE